MTAHGRIALGQLRARELGKAPPRVRWFGGYRGYGRADLLVEKLAAYLRQHQLTDTVCALRLERRPRREFYFFLTFETDLPGQLPEEVQARLEDCPLLHSGIGPCEPEQLQGFVGGEVKVKALGQCLTYRMMRQEVAEDPFRAELAADPGTLLGEVAERLLWYLSALGSGPWSTFGAACAALGAGESARRLARTLRLLGHLEVSVDGDRWSVTPPTCLRVSQPDGSALHFWAGARRADSPGERQPQRDAPSRLLAPGGEAVSLSDPAGELCALLPTLDGYRDSLSVVGGVSPAQHTFARFDGLTFRPAPFAGEPGLYEVTGREGRTLTLLYGPGGGWRRGDWSGLRYLTLRGAGLLVGARYDAGRWLLALPADQRPPELYERALVLCSGLLPDRREHWLIYRNVPPGVAQRLAERLHLPLEARDLAEPHPGARDE